MAIRFLLLYFMLQTVDPGYGQSLTPPHRYKDFVFSMVTVQKNLLYKQDPGKGIKPKYYRYDWYEPAGDSNLARPLIIWLHGGGFKLGNKRSGGLPIWGKTFARRGYVCAAINYRLSKLHPLKNFTDLVEGCADAIEDVNEAILYFKSHAQELRLDTSHIILGGNSAGGMIALQAVYSNPGAMAKLAKRGDTTMNIIQNPHQVAAVINYWGALFDKSWLQNAKVPIVSVHGKRDRVVPYDDRRPPLLGSLAIHELADKLGIPNRLKIYDRYAHELQRHFNPLFAGPGARKRWKEAGQFAADFLDEQLFHP